MGADPVFSQPPPLSPPLVSVIIHSRFQSIRCIMFVGSAQTAGTNMAFQLSPIARPQKPQGPDLWWSFGTCRLGGFSGAGL